jgi:signal transduction histidine kinase
MNDRIPPDESVALGRQAAGIAARAIEELGSEIIRQKATDIARQIEIYLQPRRSFSLESLKHDRELAKIAVVKVGRSGYSAVHDTQAINLFHPKPWVIGVDLHKVQHSHPRFWEIVERSLGQESGGYYDWPIVDRQNFGAIAEEQDAWPNSDGRMERKYMYCVPIFPRQIAPLGLVVSATISMEEFLQPSREISQRIITLSQRVDEFTHKEQRRNSQLRAVNEFSRKISSFLNAQELLPYVVDTLQKTFQLQSARIYLTRGHGSLMLAAQAGELPCPEDGETSGGAELSVVEMVARTGKPFLSKEEPGGRMVVVEDSCEPVRMAIPIKIGRDILGVLDLIGMDRKPFADMDLFTIWPLADQVAIALENARLHWDLRELAVVDERNRIAREIHDTLAQGFAGISMLSESAKQALKARETDQVEGLLERIRSLAKEKLAEARRSVQTLRPNVTLRENLETLIRGELAEIAGDMQIETLLDVTGDEQPLSPEIKMTLLRICQEALNNIKKHAHASQVKTALTYNPNAVAFYVEDDGIGFNPQTPTSNSYGLIFIRERARLIGGSVVVNSEVGKGTKIYVNIPL